MSIRTPFLFWGRGYRDTLKISVFGPHAPFENLKAQLYSCWWSWWFDCASKLTLFVQFYSSLDITNQWKTFMDVTSFYIKIHKIVYAKSNRKKNKTKQKTNTKNGRPIHVDAGSSNYTCTKRKTCITFHVSCIYMFNKIYVKFSIKTLYFVNRPDATKVYSAEKKQKVW